MIDPAVLATRPIHPRPIYRLEIDGMAEGNVGSFGFAMTAPVIRDDMKAGAHQLFHLRRPHAPVADASMQEHHGQAEAGSFATDQRLVEGDFETIGHGRRFARPGAFRQALSR